MTEHEIIHSHRRSLAERCWLLMRTDTDSDFRRELFTVQCRCGASGSIIRPLHSVVVKLSIWLPEGDIRRDGTRCPAVPKALSDEVPAAIDGIDSIDPNSLSNEEIKRHAEEYRAKLRADEQERKGEEA